MQRMNRYFSKKRYAKGPEPHKNMAKDRHKKEKENQNDIICFTTMMTVSKR